MQKQDSRHQPVQRQGVTLLELLIAVVLLLALGALVLPSLMSSLNERAFESSADVTNEQLVMARAHAQQTGSAVEVTYHPATAQVQVRLFSALTPGVGSGRASNEGLGDAGHRLPAFDATDDGSPRTEGRLLAESWACHNLPHGMRFLSSPPSALKGAPGADAFAAADDKPETIADLEKGQDIRLAVFMPDGSALMGDPVWLNDEDGRCGMFTVNPWSGLPMFERVNPGDDASKSDEASTDDAVKSGSASSPQSGAKPKTDKGRAPGTGSKPRQPVSTLDEDFGGGG